MLRDVEPYGIIGRVEMSGAGSDWEVNSNVGLQ
jgi:hypothetical protein